MDASASRPLRQWADLPGPRAWPLVGNAFQVRPHRLHRDLETWAQDYGPVYRLQIGPLRVLVLGDHEQAQAVLKARPELYSRPNHLRNIARDMGLPLGVFIAEGAEWQAQRRMVMASFAPQHVRAFLPALQRVAHRLRRRWQQAAEQQQAIDLHEDLMRFTVDVIAGLAFGAEVQTIDGGEDVIQRHLNAIFPALYRRLVAAVPYWRWVQLPQDRQLARSLVCVRTAIDDFIVEARLRLKLDPQRRQQPPNLLEAMIMAAEATPEANQPALTDEDIAANVMTMLLAGEDTTAHTLAWLLHLLSQHPDKLARAQQEVEAALAQHGLGTSAQLDALPYLDACINETMRLKPVAPYLVSEATRDTVIGQVQVPAGMQVWCLMRRDCLANAHFPDATVFRPERWLSDGSEGAEAPAAAKRVSMPFGAGPRICPGRYLALMEMKVFLTMLLSSFEVSSVGRADGQPVDEVMGFVMMPEPMQMQLRPRAAQVHAKPQPKPQRQSA